MKIMKAYIKPITKASELGVQELIAVSLPVDPDQTIDTQWTREEEEELNFWGEEEY